MPYLSNMDVLDKVVTIAVGGIVTFASALAIRYMNRADKRRDEEAKRQEDERDAMINLKHEVERVNDQLGILNTIVRTHNENYQIMFEEIKITNTKVRRLFADQKRQADLIRKICEKLEMPVL